MRHNGHAVVCRNPAAWKHECKWQENWSVMLVVSNVLERKRPVRSKRILLEDVGELVGFYEGAGLYRITNLAEKIGFPEPLPETIYVLAENKGPWENPLLNRMSMGSGYAKAMQAATRQMLLPFIEVLSAYVVRGKTIRYFIIPRGGDPMRINSILPSIGPYRSFLPPLTESVMKLSREFDPELGDYRATMETYQGDRKISGDIYIILDGIVASGSTVVGGAQVAFFGDKKLGIEGSLPRDKKVYLFTVCGSKEGLARAYRYYQQMDIELVPVFYNAIFGVVDGNNILEFLKGKTDMPFGNETITTQFMNDQADYIYGDVPICAGGDSGAHLYEIAPYSLETTQEVRLGMAKYPSNTLDLGLREWTRMRVMLGNQRWVDLAQWFYDAKLGGKAFDKMDEARELVYNMLNSPEASRSRPILF